MAEHKLVRQPVKAQEWGDLIRHLREERGWTRAELLARYQKKLELINPNYEFSEVPSDAWLARVERGESVRVERQGIDVLCDALECNASERIEVLTRADRNILNDPSIEARLLNLVVFFIAQNERAMELLRTKLDDRLANTLDDNEVLNLVSDVLHTVKQDLNPSRSASLALTEPDPSVQPVIRSPQIHHADLIPSTHATAELTVERAADSHDSAVFRRK